MTDQSPLPPHLTIRPYAAGDETALLDCWQRTMWADPIDLRTWRARYLLDPHFDPRNCPVAVTGDTVAGFILGFDRSVTTDPLHATGRDAWLVAFGVDEAHRRQGIATALLDALVTRWSTDGVARLQAGPWIPGYLTPGVDVTAYPEAIAMLATLGGRELGRSLSMRAMLTGYRAAAGTDDTEHRLRTEGLVVRPVEARDILPLIAFLEREFPHWRGDATDVLQALFAGDGRHVTMHIALDRGEIAGYAQSRLERFGPFGVDERQRGRGIGAVLLSRTLRAMRAQAFHTAWFLWTSDRAARLYQHHGFTEVRRFASITIDLAGNEGMGSR